MTASQAIHFVNEHAGFGAVDRVLLILWHDLTRPEDIVSATAALDGLVRDWGRVALFTIVEEQAILPSAEARGAVASMFTRHPRNVVASALAFEGGGFRAAAVRGVVTGISMLTKQPFPHQVFANGSAALHWLVPVVEKTSATMPRVDEITSAMEKLRAAVHAESRAKGRG